VNILIPLAAPDRYFSADEFHFPKPLVEIDGRPMIEQVVEPLRGCFPDARFIFIVKEEDCRRFNLNDVLRQITSPEAVVIPLRALTRGAVCSCLMAIEHIETDGELIVTNGDQVIEADIAAVVQRFRRQRLDAAVITFDSVHPRYSYIRTGDDGLVVEAAEKRVISRHAIAGFYYFAAGRLFVEAAMESIRHDVQIDGAFYIAPTLNELVLTGRRVSHCPVSADRYHSFYAPTLIPQYERLLQGRRLAGTAGAATGPKRLNVLIPMAGRGSRFARVGYAKPKPFIDVAGRTMIERVLDNLAIPGARYILMGRREHFEVEPDLAAQLEARPDVVLCPVDLETEGTACTVLLARRLIDGDEPLLIANCDQIVDFDCRSYIDDAVRRGLDGSILVFRDKDRDPKWSFARPGEDGLVREVREKVAISDLATVGIYHFRTGRIFIDAAVDMIARNDRTNGEFYTCPVYNYAIAAGARIGVFEIPAGAMHGLGTPEDLERYLARGTGVDGATDGAGTP
jgi:NDP-sugar pyrophosphorylase family protein